jgi:hypothetical protein
MKGVFIFVSFPLLEKVRFEEDPLQFCLVRLMEIHKEFLIRNEEERDSFIFLKFISRENDSP